MTCIYPRLRRSSDNYAVPGSADRRTTMQALGRKKLTWERVSVHDSMEGGRAAIALYHDGTKNPSCFWKRLPGGNAQRIVFACSLHIDCGVKVRAVATPSGGSALERLSGMDHSDKINEYDRVDAALTREQKSSFREAKRYGGTASDIMKNHQVAELAKPGGKRSLDTGVEGARAALLVWDGSCFMAMLVPCRHIGLHATTCECMRVHATSYARIISTFAYALILPHSTAFYCMRAHSSACAYCFMVAMRNASSIDVCIRAHSTTFNCMRVHSSKCAYALI